MKYFYGYVRENGAVGLRNHLAIIPTSVEANHVCNRIRKAIKGTVALEHQHGEIQLPEDAWRTLRILAGTGMSPNVGAVLIVGTRENDTIPPTVLAERISKTGKPVEVIFIQDYSGSVGAIEQGIQRAKSLMRKISEEFRQRVGLDKLVVGSKCGGSDTTSGLLTNPALGKAVDLLIDAGATVIFGETTEVIGAEHILVNRAATEEIGQQLLACIERWEDAIRFMGMDMRGGNPSPGNIEGGLTTIEEKSLGAISKAGSVPLQGIVEYGQSPSGSGLYFMDSPGNDIECVTGMVAAGAQLVCFTTGRGTPTGAAVAPVMKLCSNPVSCKSMADNIDFDGSGMLRGEYGLEVAGERIFHQIIDISSGREVKAEILGHREFSINRIAMSR